MNENEDNNIKDNIEDNKIKFFKKIYYSIFKISKYDDMIKMGLKDAIKYLLKLTAIVTLILSLFLSFNMKKYVSKISDFLNENVPDFYIEDNILNLSNEDAIILDNEQIINNLNCIIIINTLLDKDEVIKTYQDIIQNDNCMILIKDNVIFVPKGYSIKTADTDIENKVEEERLEEENEKTEDPNENSENNELKIEKYDELLSNYNIKIESKFTKSDLIDKINSNPVTYYFVQYFIIYYVILLFTFIIEIVLAALIIWIFMKILKIQLNNKKEIFILSIYEFTLPIILQLLYLVISIIFNFSVDSSIIQTIMMLIALIYGLRILHNKKK